MKFLLTTLVALAASAAPAQTPAIQQAADDLSALVNRVSALEQRLMALEAQLTPRTANYPATLPAASYAPPVFSTGYPLQAGFGEGGCAGGSCGVPGRVGLFRRR